MENIFYLLGLIPYLPYKVRILYIDEKRAFALTMQYLAIVPGRIGEWWRQGMLSWVTGRRIKDCCICFGTLFSDPNLYLKDGIYIGPRSDVGLVTIGENTIIGSGVHILSGKKQHFFKRRDIPIKNQGGNLSRVTIGNDVWIGNGAIVASDVGEGAIVGAGAVVVDPVDAYSIVGGNPARVLSYR